MDLGLLGENLEQYYYFICSIPEFSNKVGEYLKDSKDVIIALLAVIFIIYIPFLLYFYQEINKKQKFKYIDLYIFHKNIFNLRKIIFYLLFLIITLLFWNSGNSSIGYGLNIVILLLSVFSFRFFIKSIVGIYDLNENLNKEKSSGNIINIRLNSLKNLELNKSNLYLYEDILKKENLKDNYFTGKFLKILIKKIEEKVTKNPDNEWESEQLIRNLLSSYNKLNNQEVLNSFQVNDFKSLISLYKADKNSKKFHLSSSIMNIIISKLEKFSGDTFLIIEHLKDELNISDNENFKYDFLSHFHSEILQSEILLEDRDFMEKYGKDIYTKYKNIYKKYEKNNCIVSSMKLQSNLYKFFVDLIWSEYSEIKPGYSNVVNYWLRDFEPNLFIRLMILYFKGYGDTKAKSIIEYKPKFTGLGKWRMYDVSNGENIETLEKQERQNTIRIFYNDFEKNTPNFKDLLSQFNNLKKENDLNNSEKLKCDMYISLINELQSKKDEN